MPVSYKDFFFFLPRLPRLGLELGITPIITRAHRVNVQLAAISSRVSIACVSSVIACQPVQGVAYHDRLQLIQYLNKTHIIYFIISNKCLP